MVVIEIAFGESARGGLLTARGYGRGSYTGGAVSVIVRRGDGKPATQEEIGAAKQRYEARERLAWENAVPLDVGDVMSFDRRLSEGDIRDVREPGLGDVLRRCGAGEDVRVWYSEQPDERCGMVWLLAQLRTVSSVAQVWLVELPKLVCDADCARTHMSWGEVEPGAWGRLANTILN